MAENMIELYVISDYRNREIFFKGGTIIEVNQALADFLCADAPENFRVGGPPIETPPSKAMDKPIRTTTPKKARNK